MSIFVKTGQVTVWVVIRWGRGDDAEFIDMPSSEVLPYIVRQMAENDLPASRFNSLEIQVFRNQPTGDKELDAMENMIRETILSEGLEIGTEESTLDGFPDITIAEIAEIRSKDPLWDKVGHYGGRFQTITSQEWPEVAQRFYDKYGHTKFYKIHEHKMPSSIRKRDV